MIDWKKLLDLNYWSGISPPASAHAQEIDFMLLLVHWFMLILFVFWTAFFLRILWRFRRTSSPKADYHGFRGHHTTYAEVAVIVIEAVLLLALAFPLWARRVNEFPARGEAVEVRVIGEQFAWNIHYPGPDGKFGKRALHLVSPDNPVGVDRTDPDGADDVVTMNQLHLPVDRDAILHIGSKDVIHSVAIRQMRVCQDAIPGMSIPAWFRPNVTTDQMRKNMLGGVIADLDRGARQKLDQAIGQLPGGMKEFDEMGFSGQKQMVLQAMGVTEESLSMPAEERKQPLTDLESKLKDAIDFQYEIMCAQLCGLGHYRMRGFVTIETQEQYDAWIAEQAKQAQEAAAGGGGGEYE